MTGAEILDEHTKGEWLTDAVLAALLRQGVDTAALARRVAAGQLDEPRLDRVVYVGGNGFEFSAYMPSEPDTVAMTFVCRDSIGEPIDLAAWSPPMPPALWCSRASLLGGENVFRPRITEGLLVHPSPLEWLHSAGHGVVVVDPKKARGLLYRSQPLEVASVAHGRELRRIMEVKPPQILVSTTWRAAA